MKQFLHNASLSYFFHSEMRVFYLYVRLLCFHSVLVLPLCASVFTFLLESLIRVT